jgi:hypothetical protein
MALSAEEITEYRERYAIPDSIEEIRVWKTESDSTEHYSLLYFTDDHCSAFTGYREIIIGVESVDGELLPYPTLKDTDNVWKEFTGDVE